MILRKTLLAALALFLGAGCATTVDLPLTHFQSSETVGQNRGKLDGGYHMQSSVVFSNDITLYAPDTENPRIEQDRGIFVGGAYGVAERFDLGARSPTYFYGKFQALGNSRSAAVESDFSLSVFAAAARDVSGDDTTGIFSTTRYEAKVETFYVDTGVVAGFRTSKTLLIYGGPFFTHAKYDGKYRETPSGGSTTETSFDGKIRSVGGTFGVDFTYSNLGVMVETAFSRTKTRTVSDTIWGIGFMGSILF